MHSTIDVTGEKRKALNYHATYSVCVTVKRQTLSQITTTDVLKTCKLYKKGKLDVADL